MPDAPTITGAHPDLTGLLVPLDNAHDAMGDVWTFSRVTGQDRHGHATPKPVPMVERAFLTSSRPGDLIGVPFGGSGPEFVAAHRTGRRVCAIELSPTYVDVICRRYQEHTGTLPILEATGEPHDFTADAPASSDTRERADA